MKISTQINKLKRESLMCWAVENFLHEKYKKSKRVKTYTSHFETITLHEACLILKSYRKQCEEHLEILEPKSTRSQSR